MTIKLAKANTIIRTALKKGGELNLKPLTVAVLDAGGHLIALQRSDGASIMRPQMASGKAFGALAMGMGSASLEKAVKERPHFAEGLHSVAPQGIVPVAGGVLVRNKRGEIIGAVGITGDTSDNDQTCAMAGIEAAGFLPDPG